MTTHWSRDLPSCLEYTWRIAWVWRPAVSLSSDYHPSTAVSVLLLSPCSSSVSLISTPDQGAAAGAGRGPWQPPGPARAAVPGAAAPEGGGRKLQSENGAGGWGPVLHLLHSLFPEMRAETLLVLGFFRGKHVRGNLCLPCMLHWCLCINCARLEPWACHGLSVWPEAHPVSSWGLSVLSMKYCPPQSWSSVLESPQS